MGAFFEDFYRRAGDDLERIPWAHLAPRPPLVDWLERHPPAAGTPALVVACGLGDDAAELARRGCAVEAFDLSPTAIAHARRRFPQAGVGWSVADLFALPAAWRRRFALVVEVQTLQSLPPERQRAGVAAVAASVAPGGHLLVRAAVRRPGEPLDGPPWPLEPETLGAFEREEGFSRRAACADGVFAHLDLVRD